MHIHDSVTTLPQVSTRYAQALARLGIFTIRDLLIHAPRYQKDTSQLTKIGDIQEEGSYVIKAAAQNVTSVRIRGNRSLQRAVLTDDSGNIATTWFNQPYLQRTLKSEQEYLFSGRVKLKGTRVEFYPNSFEAVIPEQDSIHLGRISPQYRLTQGVSIKWLRNRIKFVLDQIENIEGLEEEQEIHPELLTELQQIHFPDDLSQYDKARFDLGVLELAQIQLRLEHERRKATKRKANPVSITRKKLDKFLTELPFELTQDQQTAVDQILQDMADTKPMFRLLQGDVGSGKTIVAIIAAYAAKLAGLQTAIMAPTTVLANQHFHNFTKIIGEHASIELVTGENTDTASADILIGTSAVLFRKEDLIANLGLLVIDEQHRFGVSQRVEIVKHLSKNKVRLPHVLDMTATPIPRTMALALFGEVEVSNILTKPAGRLPILTKVLPESKRSDSYAWLKKQVLKGDQIYWIAPLVEESEQLQAKSAIALHQELSSKVFPKLKIGLLHGKLPAKEKTSILEQFSDKKIDILVSTSVIEVGIDNPNATIILIESPERFGLAQLHQLRGRVGRGTKQSWCFLLPGETREENLERLHFFSEHNDGLEIAEYDLQTRGPGEVYGTQQAGIPDLKIAQISELKQIQASRKLASELYARGIKQIGLFVKQN